MYQPQRRSLIGMFVILVWMTGWIGGIAHFAPTISQWPVLVQAVFYLITGLIWIIPTGSVLRWMATGDWRKPKASGEQPGE